MRTSTLPAQPPLLLGKKQPPLYRHNPIVLYFKVYALILFYFQDLTMLLLF
jgi:hypothetical protein